MPPLPPKARHALEKLLAGCYPAQEDARRVALDAGLDTRLIGFHAVAMNSWSSIVERAALSDKLAGLLDLVHEEQDGAEVREKLSALRATLGLPLPPASTSAKPATQTTSRPQPVDLGIVVALPEELRELRELAGTFEPCPGDGLNAYLFTRGGYRCAVALVGGMGQGPATQVTERFIAGLDPASILSVGIAAGVHEDLCAGDVHVPSQAVEYLQDAKAAASGRDSFELVPGPPACPATFALHTAVVGFEFNHPDAYQGFRDACRADFEEVLRDASKRRELVEGELVRGEVELRADGHVATGPVVVAAPALLRWLRSHQRNVKSLEMESAAVMLSAQLRAEPKHALAIRGISDYGDSRKKKLDKLGKGALRRYAMRNAVRLLFALLEVGALPHRPR